MIQEALSGALRPMHRQAGLTLVEVDDHMLALQTKSGRNVAYFSQLGATIDGIQKAADFYMTETDLISQYTPATVTVQIDMQVDQDEWEQQINSGTSRDQILQEAVNNWTIKTGKLFDDHDKPRIVQIDGEAV